MEFVSVNATIAVLSRYPDALYVFREGAVRKGAFSTY